ncbi:MAG TPA: TIGR03086 family metal-binding protein [Streptosporangiaceae bacterium]|nr:TIGR03086 family metal-binding protein [Streptosporangiaceae bacterium]
MSSRSGELLDQGLDFVTGIIIRLGEPDWERPSPCAGWTARDVVGHLAATMGVAVSAMQGRPRAEPGVARPGDLVGGDPARFWRDTATGVRDVLRGADLGREMQTPLGHTVADDLAIPVMDLYVHAWDLGVVAGIGVEIPADVIDYAHAYLDPLPGDVVRGPGRAFGPQAPVPAGATATERFIAWTGRELPQ